MSTTIAGIATAPGEGGIAIIRVSGDKATELFSAVFRSPSRKPPYADHQLMYGKIVEGENILDEVMGVVMYAPYTYTRENVCEIHTHGGYAAAQNVLRLLLRLGAVPAEPGEFTRRAFMNGRIDLMQAEAVMGIISARSEAAFKSEERLLKGGQSAFIRDGQKKLTELLAGLEAHIDYPDEIDYEEACTGLRKGLEELQNTLSRAVNFRSAKMIREGVHVAVFGRPNAGKSTLFNALLGEDRAIVSNIPGTTRDVLEGSFPLDGYNVFLRDTAGLRSSADPVEVIGVNRARQTIESADTGLLLIDACETLQEEDILLLKEARDCPCAVLLTKQDSNVIVTEDEIKKISRLDPIIPISAKTGLGLDRVRDFLRNTIPGGNEELLTHERHMQLVSQACEHLKSALNILNTDQPLDLAGIDMHEALFLLGRITGESVDEALLDDIFSRFCVGK